MILKNIYKGFEKYLRIFEKKAVDNLFSQFCVAQTIGLISALSQWIIALLLDNLVLESVKICLLL